MSGIFLTGDLMFSSRVTGTARQRGIAMAVVGSAEQLLEKVSAGDVNLVVLDLSVAGLDVAETIARLRQGGGEKTTVVAYAPHVHEEKLAAAVEAGCDEVLSRGQFNSRLDEIVDRAQST